MAAVAARNGRAGDSQWQEAATKLAARIKQRIAASDGLDAAAAASPAGVKIAAILRCGELTGEAVEYRRGGPASGRVLEGTITGQGLITCTCQTCK
jgi:hypothetical protein